MASMLENTEEIFIFWPSKQLFDELKSHARGHKHKEKQINAFIDSFTNLLTRTSTWAK